MPAGRNSVGAVAIRPGRCRQICQRRPNLGFLYQIQSMAGKSPPRSIQTKRRFQVTVGVQSSWRVLKGRRSKDSRLVVYVTFSLSGTPRAHHPAVCWRKAAGLWISSLLISELSLPIMYTFNRAAALTAPGRGRAGAAPPAPAPNPRRRPTRGPWDHHRAVIFCPWCTVYMDSR